MRQFSRREQIMVGLCAACVAAVFLPGLLESVAGGVSPERARAQLRQARRDRATNATMLARLERDLGRVTERRPPAALPSLVMGRLDQRARAEGITLREVRPLPERPLDGATGVPLQFSFTAPFPRAARFLAGLRTRPDGMAVDRVVIAATGKESDQVSVQARVLAFSTVTTTREASRG